ncbi:MAG: hypothetical protein E7052_04010 [Lentisphaerae bacterium]|nr:hypothetical protein [Lentisphaerota bacterium]
MITQMIFGAIEPLALQGNVRLAVAIIFGIVLGVILVKCDLIDRVQVKSELTFGSMKLCKTLLLALGVGLICFILLRSAHVVQPQLAEMTFLGTLFGGILVGIGLGIGGLVPITAVAALGAGRFYAVWFILGMVLAFPAAQFIREHCSGVLAKLSSPLNASLENSSAPWSWENPALWFCAAAIILSLIVHFCGAKDSK